MKLITNRSNLSAFIWISGSGWSQHRSLRQMSYRGWDQCKSATAQDEDLRLDPSLYSAASTNRHVTPESSKSYSRTAAVILLTTSKAYGQRQIFKLYLIRETVIWEDRINNSKINPSSSSSAADQLYREWEQSLSPSLC